MLMIVENSQFTSAIVGPHVVSGPAVEGGSVASTHDALAPKKQYIF